MLSLSEKIRRLKRAHPDLRNCELASLTGADKRLVYQALRHGSRRGRPRKKKPGPQALAARKRYAMRKKLLQRSLNGL